MGARCAPSYANLFLGWWECTVVYLIPEFQQWVAHWHRYIDDIVFFWTGPLEQCQEFVRSLNNNPWNIHLTANFSFSTADFPDLR